MDPMKWTLGIVLSGLFFHVACDDEQKPASAVPAASASAASTSTPTPEKAAGVEYGTVKLCVVIKGGAGAPETVNVSVMPIFVQDSDKHEKVVTLKKEESKGYCDFVHAEFSRWWGNRLEVKPTDVPLDEVGIYYLKDWKENPGSGDLTYGKAVKLDDGAFALGVLIASANIPVVQITVKE
jgi:hypothetical protein